MKGIVDWFDPIAGYGFIDGDKERYFVHYKDIVSEDNFKSLLPGDRVKFDLNTDELERLRASNVEILERAKKGEKYEVFKASNNGVIRRRLVRS
jgi:cold shock CspA family protein